MLPWRGDPTGLLISPLALLALVYTGKRKRSKLGVFVALLVVCGVLSLGLAGCGPTTPGDGTPIPITETPPNYNDTPTPGTVNPSTPTPGGTPIETPTYTCTPSPTQNGLEDLGDYLITHYNYALESDPFFSGCNNCYDANIPVWENGRIEYKTHNLAFVYGVPDEGSVSGFNWGVYQEGTGITKDGKYISIDYQHKTLEDRIVFTYNEGGRCTHLGYRAEAWKTVAASNSRLTCGSQITIDRYPGIIFTVTDTGSEVGDEHLDVFVGPMNVEDFKSQFSSSGSTYFQSKVMKVK